jgi:hypothetical protein
VGDPEIQRAMDGANRLGVVELALAGVGTGHGHGSEADAGDFQGAEVGILHV